MNNNNGSPKEEQVQECQRLRLDLWDMPGSTSSCGITHQVLLNKYKKIHFHIFSFQIDIFIIKSDLFTCI
jgi:hypothetical protein